MKPNVEDDFCLLFRRLQEKHDEIVKYRVVSAKFSQGKASEAYKADFDDSSWKTTVLQRTFDARRGEAWLRFEAVVPTEICGIDVSGSAMKISSSIILDKVEVFVNSERVFSADYWAEFRGPKIVLTNEAKPQTKYVVAFHIYPKIEPVELPEISITYSRVEKVAFEISSFIQELRFAKLLDEKTAIHVSREFDLKVFESKPADVLKEIEKARVKLSGLASRAKEFRVHLVAHAHIDMNWLWPWKDTVDTIKNTFTTMASLLDKYPDFHFSQSQAVTYKVAEEQFPDLFEAMKRHVKRGNWDPTASMWVEPDLNMAGTEALVRQFLQAKGYLKEKFGVEPKTCWEPDTFGHIWTLPQILNKTGLKYYYFMRCRKEPRMFWWEGPDGSRVLAFTSVYNNVVTPKNVVDLAVELYEGYGLKSSMFVYGAGDHGGGATVEDIEAAHEMQKKSALPDIVFSSTQSFYEEAERMLGEKAPVIRDELQFTLDGCYTTHGDIKRYNRLCERLLVDAEKFSVFSGYYQKEALQKAWRNMLFNQFHDILDGSGTTEAYVYPRELAEETIKIADGALRASLGKLAKTVKFSEQGVPIVVFNPLAWDRVDVVKVKMPKRLMPKNPTAVSSDGVEKAPVQVSGDEVLFLTKVPSIGYKTYYLVEGEGSEVEPQGLFGSENMLKNEYFRVEVDKALGVIKSLYDNRESRFVFKADRYEHTMPMFSNLLQVLHEAPHDMSAWIIGPITRIENLMKGAKVELAEAGPVRAMIKVSHRYRKSEITQYVALYRGVPRIDFEMNIDWKEVSDDKVDAPMLKVSFTPILGRTKATYEIPFGYVERVADGTEVPAHRWVDVSDGEYGLSLLNNCKYGFDVTGNTVRMTLVRTSYSPDPRPDQGEHEILYSLYPHCGGWKEALTFRRGIEINHPLEAYVVTDKSAAEGAEREEKSFLTVKPDNVVLSGIKLAEDSDDYIVRIYDATGAGADAELAFNFAAKEASEVDLTERKLGALKLKGNGLSVPLRPFEIKTIRIGHG
jgi:alpha-mannosidase